MKKQMSEIEELYSKAGLVYCGKCRHDSELDCIYLCESKHPPFTAEKQLELVKFLFKKAVYYSVIDNKYWFYLDEVENANYKPFDEAIAEFINNLWKDFTEENKKQIVEILK